MVVTLTRNAGDANTMKKRARDRDDMVVTLTRNAGDASTTKKRERHRDDMVVTLTRNAGDASTMKKRARHRDDGADEYACHDDSHASYISGRLDCDEAAPMVAAWQHFHQRRHTAAILVSISALTVLVVATFILALGLVVGRRYWRRSVDVDYCKQRQSQLLQHEHHPGAQPDEPAASRRLLLLLAWKKLIFTLLYNVRYHSFILAL